MPKILITDDDEALRAVMCAAVKRAGHTVLEAACAREALRLHDETPADLVVTDMVMNDMDGTELLRRIRTKSPAIPVIAVSGAQNGTIYLNMARLIGADCILAKPFSPADLTAKIAQVLSGSTTGKS